jgi:predicted ABC-type ATPase
VAIAREFWIVAGANGSGKSTFSARALASCLNPDLFAAKASTIVKLVCPSRYAGLVSNWLAVVWVEWRVWYAIRRGLFIAVETVLGSRKYAKHIRAAKARGYFVGMHYVALATVENHIERVAMRVAVGGHNVPNDKIRKRWATSLTNLQIMAPMVDALYVWDNSLGNPVLVAVKEDGKLRVLLRGRLPHVLRVLS